MKNDAVLKNCNDPEAPTSALDFINEQEAEKILGVCKTTLWRMSKEGKLKKFYVGSRVRYLRTDVYALITPAKAA